MTCLRKTTLPLREIAPLCGFADSYYRRRTFKKYIVTNPSDYRESVRGGEEAERELPPKRQ